MRKEKVEIKKLGINGEGIGYIDRKICFVEGALPGEIVEVEIVSTNPKYYKGRLMSCLESSPYRVKSICKEDKFCQGCAFTNYAYNQQLPYKKGVLKDALKKFTDFDVETLPIQPTVEAKSKRAYRQVVELPVAYFKGKVNVGIYQRESKYLTLMSGCPMQDSLINECLVKIENILNEYKVRDYNDKVKKGMRFLKLRNIDGQIQVVFVTGEDGLSQDVIQAVSQIQEVKSIYYTINTTRHQEFDLQGYKKVYGQSTVSYQCFGQNYVYSIKSQFPLYPHMEVKKMDIIKEMIPSDVSVLSIQCGIGLMELSMDNKIVAIDEKNYHIKDAKDNAKFLHKDHVEFICKNVDEAIIQQCKKRQFDYVVIRSEGLTNAMKQSLVLSKVKDVIYVSDHPSAIAKDIQELSKYYRIETMIPLDTYPNTTKFDTIVKLHRK